MMLVSITPLVTATRSLVVQPGPNNTAGTATPSLGSVLATTILLVTIIPFWGWMLAAQTQPVI